jgi:2-methylcitrate dehydratase PrpD
VEHTKAIAEFIADARFEGVPESARVAARSALIDAVGVALGGSVEAPARIAAELARDEQAKPDAAVFGHGFRTSAQQAAWVNGVAAHALDFDASYVTMGQPMAGLVPAVFALAEPLGASGRELLTAYLVGYEVTGKLVRTAAIQSDSGAWHATATYGTLGCTAAAARLLKLGVDETRMALGIAASMASGIVSNFGTMTKPLHAGLGARNGVLAAKLAQRGFTGHTSVLETTNGYFPAFAGGTPQATHYLEELGQVWEIEQGVRYKAYPCGGLSHTAIDAALALRQEHRLHPDIIDSIDVQVSGYTASRIVFGLPENETQAKFSMGYVVARALVDGQLAPDSFDDDAIRDPETLALARKVHMTVDPAFVETRRVDGAGQRVNAPATVTIRFTDGRTVTHQVFAPKGGPENPMTSAELEGKFLTCALRVLSGGDARQAMEMLRSIEDVADVGSVAELLAGRPTPASAHGH